MKRSRMPPVRRIVQAIVVIGAWLALFGFAASRALGGSIPAIVAIAVLLALEVWAIDAFVPWLGRGAILRGLPVQEGEAPRVALTFDDGPSPDTPAVLAALAREGVRATFFMLGRHAAQHPEYVRAVMDAGHVIGNHTWSHRVLALAPPAAVKDEVDQTQAILTRLGVQRPVLFRAPRGFQGPHVRAVLRKRGLALIGWTRGAWDSERRPAEDIAALAAADPKDGDILLLHDGAGTPGEQRRDRTAEAIPFIVEAYRRRGFRFVTVPEILRPGEAGA